MIRVLLKFVSNLTDKVCKGKSDGTNPIIVRYWMICKRSASLEFDIKCRPKCSRSVAKFVIGQGRAKKIRGDDSTREAA